MVFSSVSQHNVFCLFLSFSHADTKEDREIILWRIEEKEKEEEVEEC